MPPAPVIFHLDDLVKGRRILESISQQFAHSRLAPERRQTTYYDTFDWRVYRNGCVLTSRFSGRSRVLSCLQPDGLELFRCPLATKPGFVGDLPVGALRQALEQVLEMRRLLPLFTVETDSETLNLLDGRRKILARLSVERSRVHPARTEHPSCQLPDVLRAEPVRGYDRDFTQLLRALEVLELERSSMSEFLAGAEAAGLEPGDYSGRLDLHLEPEMRSEEALRTILRRLLEVMRANQDGLTANLDSEFLHDFRVAVRRTRSALGQLGGVLPSHEVAHFKTEFSWLGQITGPTRDLDVYQLSLAGYRSSLPGGLQEDLAPLGDFLERHRALEHQEMIQLLQTGRFTTLLSDWERFLDRAVTEAPDRPAAATPILSLASERIWRRYGKVLERGRAIGPETPASALHRLRIDCKKLRYLLEFFRSLYPSARIRNPIRSLKRLQDNLGRVNDLQVQQEMLERFAQDMQVEKVGTVRTLLAMGRLAEILERRQLETRKAFHQRFRKFSNRQSRHGFATLFEPKETSKA